MIRQGDKSMGRVTVEVHLANGEDLVRAADGTIRADQIRKARINAVVDTGAAHLVIPRSMAVQLGVPFEGEARVRYADLRSAIQPVATHIDVELLGRHGTFKAIVEPKRKDALIGAIVLEDLDLVVDCVSQTLLPRDPNRIIAEIE